MALGIVLIEYCLTMAYTNQTYRLLISLYYDCVCIATQQEKNIVDIHNISVISALVSKRTSFVTRLIIAIDPLN